MKRQSPEEVSLSEQSREPEVVYKILRQLRKAIQTLRILFGLGFQQNEDWLKFKILKQQNSAVMVIAWGLRWGRPVGRAEQSSLGTLQKFSM